MFDPVADQLLDGQAVDRQAGQRADDGARGLEPQREDADEEVARGGELGLVDRRVADPVELGQHVDDGRDGDLGVDGGASGERTGAAAQVEAGAGAVRVALLLAELHVQPRVEQAAEDRAHHRDGVEVGDPPRQADVADPDLGLDRARPVDDPDEPARRTSRCRRSRHRRSPPCRRPSRPTSEQPLGDRRDVEPGEVAADDERRPRRVERRAGRPARRASAGRAARRCRASRRTGGGTASSAA